MRPAMSDSLISGQPLYLLYSYSQRGAVPADAGPLRVARATQATGSVRLQVTGKPPTTNALVLLDAHPNTPSGRLAARPCKTWRRERIKELMGLDCPTFGFASEGRENELGVAV